MSDLIVFGMSLHDFMKWVFILAPIYGVLMAIFMTWGERRCKPMSDELDRLAGPADELGDGGFLEQLKRSIKNAWRRQLWLPLAVLKALTRRRRK